MPSEEGKKTGVDAIAGLIARRDARTLFLKLCDEIARFSGAIDIEAALFEVRFSGPGDFRITLTAYRELFLVSIGGGSACDVRVSSDDTFLAALDLSLHHFLETQSHIAN
jgi:hypothetical protein